MLQKARQSQLQYVSKERGFTYEVD